jgi:hypothetical protein
METKKVIALSIGLLGFLMVFYSLAQGTVTGSVIGANSTSKLLGVFGVILMIIAVFIERYKLDK